MPTSLLVHGERPVRIATPSAVVEAQLSIPAEVRALVILAHAAPHSAYADGNRFVADALRAAGFATLVVNLLTANESVHDTETSDLRFRLPLLAARFGGVTSWAALHPRLRELPVGYFAGGVSASAALESAAESPQLVASIVSRGGRPELAAASLREVRAPVLLLVGERDTATVTTNQRALERMSPATRLQVIPGAGHRLDEESSLTMVAELAAAWFERTLPDSTASETVDLRVASRR